MCTYDPCPFVVDRYLVTTDGGHLTATYSAKVWRALDLLIPAPDATSPHSRSGGSAMAHPCL